MGTAVCSKVPYPVQKVYSRNLIQNPTHNITWALSTNVDARAFSFTLGFRTHVQTLIGTVHVTI